MTRQGCKSVIIVQHDNDYFDKLVIHTPALYQSGTSTSGIIIVYSTALVIAGLVMIVCV